VETLGRWHTADLFFGLAYLSQRDGTEHVAADIAAKAIPLASGLSPAHSAEMLVRAPAARLGCTSIPVHRPAAAAAPCPHRCPAAAPRSLSCARCAATWCTARA
jgi:hypothetical protein